jgi:hypothetical protein
MAFDFATELAVIDVDHSIPVRFRLSTCPLRDNAVRSRGVPSLEHMHGSVK